MLDPLANLALHHQDTEKMNQQVMLNADGTLGSSLAYPKLDQAKPQATALESKDDDP